ncbi:MAG: phosphoribosylanthranilate isomerase [Anaerolineae bacterium]|nr:phosphoribosylanthranilate isomerase [Anaerolineae bacterium]
MVKVKICGMMTLEDARLASAAGADLLGFNFYKKSPRYIAPDAAFQICDALRAELGSRCPVLIGLFVNEVAGVISAVTRKVGLNGAQLSGDESDALLKELYGIGYKAIRPMNRAQALDDVEYFRPQFPTNPQFPSLLLDAYHPQLYGGTGEQASVEVALAVKAVVPRLMLAGGLTPENVGERIENIQPWGVDVASGVEIEGQPGRKDPERVRAFIDAVRRSET